MHNFFTFFEGFGASQIFEFVRNASDFCEPHAPTDLIGLVDLQCKLHIHLDLGNTIDSPAGPWRKARMGEMPPGMRESAQNRGFRQAELGRQAGCGGLGKGVAGGKFMKRLTLPAKTSASACP
jgi:hypothetical protein